MSTTHRQRLWLAAIALLILQAVLALAIVHRESLTFDEDDHMFAGYMMWKAADYGLNPEHPPLVKLLAWQAAVQIAKQLEPEAQVSYVPDLEAKIEKANP